MINKVIVYMLELWRLNALALDYYNSSQKADGANNRHVLHVRPGSGSLSITAPVSLPANEFVV